MDDPILLTATAVALILTPLLSILISKKRLKNVFLIPITEMIIAFPIFFLLVIAQGGLPQSMLLLVLSMSLWTGGFFGIFFSIFYYNSKKKKR